MYQSTKSLILYFIKKILWILVVLWGITIVSFIVIHLAPGSPTDLQTTLNPMAGETTKQRLESLYGINRPIYVQYIDWLSRIIRFDFGTSMSADARPVIVKIFERLPLTVFMNVLSLAISLMIAIPLGVLSAWKQDSLFDKLITILVFLGFAMPGFWLALLLMLWFGLDLQWFPISGITSLDFSYLSLWGKIKDVASHLVLPIIVMTVGSIAGISRFMRASMLEVLRQDFILTAKAKGLSTWKVIFRHALRNALLPVITLLGLSVPGLIGGSVIIESIFALPGLGQLFYTAVMARDYPLIMGNLVLGAILTLLGNFLADVCYGIADPRIRQGAIR
ncbi:ABC transporter permease [Lawsonia intracellularis]|uniref:ABC-type dipeptide/oligopeptide/nickel transport systems, permease components n=1 Tax=Lawsonia intracellularis (strain PHE/MN1-00) TaxID=363253 RepID=Q1MRR9_LAWIP|nr:ABC transporter permease [Lawsonia intracellularis]AGC49660.1 binding-protein-dependent transport system inner membrane component [Lawsonia intracellularis N343]KAA0205472.1 ABC transporter permease [Lawsonia intracellularis]MBZ3892306.1 ABC transporter permease [Lawsonia intracellularis]OMQ05897.1 diguanylate cyclase [Lawsonia intracellularis]RBN32583.1 ABC transporter permease [Lawsonia intracellularis]